MPLVILNSSSNFYNLLTMKISSALELGSINPQIYCGIGKAYQLLKLYEKALYVRKY